MRTGHHCFAKAQLEAAVEGADEGLEVDADADAVKEFEVGEVGEVERNLGGSLGFPPSSYFWPRTIYSRNGINHFTEF